MEERKGQVNVTVANGTKTVGSKAEVLEMQEGLEMVIGLDQFKEFGFEVRGVTTFPPKARNVEDENKLVETPMPSEDHDVVDGLTAADIDPEVQAEMERNQTLSPMSHCYHQLQFLPLKPIYPTPVWRRMNFVSKKDEDEVTEVIERWLTVKVIKPAPEECLN